MHNIIIGVIAVILAFVVLFVLYRIWTYRPRVSDAGDACGHCCLMFMLTVGLLIISVLLYAYLISLLL